MPLNTNKKNVKVDYGPCIELTNDTSFHWNSWFVTMTNVVTIEKEVVKTKKKRTSSGDKFGTMAIIVSQL